jgi:hypothetical protein
VKDKMKGSIKQIMVIELARLGKWSIYVKRVVFEDLVVGWCLKILLYDMTHDA